MKELRTTETSYHYQIEQKKSRLDRLLIDHCSRDNSCEHESLEEKYCQNAIESD